MGKGKNLLTKNRPPPLLGDQSERWVGEGGGPLKSGGAALNGQSKDEFLGVKRIGPQCGGGKEGDQDCKRGREEPNWVKYANGGVTDWDKGGKR